MILSTICILKLGVCHNVLFLYCNIYVKYVCVFVIYEMMLFLSIIFCINPF